MIEIKNLTKSYKDKIAVDNLTFDIKPGVVTGFLGPNGAGKSTTMRMILNLVRPTKGEITIDGKRYVDLERPGMKIGALIDADAVNPKFSAKQHLELIATASDIPIHRVEDMLKKTGLEKVKNKLIGEFSLGMQQRLGIAAALLGDPEVIIFDEPFNGLDVDGIKWIRGLTKELARQGKSVLISSHLMGEVQSIAERIIILAQGKLVADMTVEQMLEKSLSAYIKVKSQENVILKKLLVKDGASIIGEDLDMLHVRGIEMERIGILSKVNNIAIFELTEIEPTLEQLFTELTNGKVDYVSSQKITKGEGDLS